LKILIIDAEKNICLTLNQILSDEGYEVITANTARTGLQLAEESDADIILLDVKLPDLNGIEVLSKLRKSQAQTPVIMISETAVLLMR
jgi:DNA-binding response OmpR family regulator